MKLRIPSIEGDIYKYYIIIGKFDGKTKMVFKRLLNKKAYKVQKDKQPIAKKAKDAFVKNVSEIPKEKTVLEITIPNIESVYSLANGIGELAGTFVEGEERAEQFQNLKREMINGLKRGVYTRR